ncbi:hypothetical protein [Thalassospira lucentensis]|jgi:hypothetical protein|uniref:hypothetical protein n=1 Tax=Thalassospira lucentensis TaxID=168935 RepID=UPI0003B49E1A|nr:hypothetical protein [Thalassospira lucentensis]RCK21690.1 hypothetical protein TH1_18160 [Thalassospira lucentensis MCCC 1A00383 = DSM 14000]|tara:strand:- start:511 stop:1083 length:573 start_codon:yes stop_codon:yes gene_type:complete
MAHKNIGKRYQWFVSLFMLSWLFLPISAQAASIEPFLGEYHGETIEHAEGELQARDLDVKIVKADRGFIVDWTTVIHKSDGREKTASLNIEFYGTDRPDIYGSAMRSGLFGKRVPNDPLKGEPFFWARIVDRTLTIHALYITDDGGYEMQVYERKLDDEGNMELIFKRFRNGEPIRDVTGKLLRQEKKGY